MYLLMALGNSIISVLPTTTHAVTCRRIRIFCRNTLMPSIVVEEVWPLPRGTQRNGRGKGRGQRGGKNVHVFGQISASPCTPPPLCGLQRLRERGACQPAALSPSTPKALITVTDRFLVLTSQLQGLFAHKPCILLMRGAESGCFPWTTD